MSPKTDKNKKKAVTELMKKHKDKTHSLMDDYKIDDTSMTVYFDGGRGLETFTFDEILENPKILVTRRVLTEILPETSPKTSPPKTSSKTSPKRGGRTRKLRKTAATLSRSPPPRTSSFFRSWWSK